MPAEPTPEDGPLFQAAYRRGDAVDKATAGPEKRRAWTRFIPTALVALAEGWLRESMITGAVLLSVFAAAIGVTSGDTGWAVGCAAAGVGGVALLIVARLRHWRFGVQWAVILGVVALQAVLMTIFWQSH
jgi:hypothetical protein